MQFFKLKKIYILKKISKMKKKLLKSKMKKI